MLLQEPMNIPHMNEISKSIRPMKTAKIAENTSTTPVELASSSRVGQLTLENSTRTSLQKLVNFAHIPRLQTSWQVWQDSNLQPLVLETSALPIELQTYFHYRVSL